MPDTATRLRVLIVEDSGDDAALLLRGLRKIGYEPDYERVESAGTMRAALSSKPWDIIFSDYVIPGFGGIEALAIARDSGLGLPFILVTGKVGEETAVEAMRAGASDFILKGRLGRLGPVVKRELADAAARRGLRQAETEWRVVFDSVHDAIFMHDAEFRITRANLAYAELAGVAIQTVIGKRYWDVFPRLDGPLGGCKTSMESGTWSEEEVILADGHAYLSRNCPIPDNAGNNAYSLHILQDITQRKRAEDMLRDAEARFRGIFTSARDGIVLVDANSGYLIDCNPEYERQCGRRLEQLKRLRIWELRPPEAREAARAKFMDIKATGSGGSGELPLQRPDGTVVPVEFVSTLVRFGDRDYVQSMSRDITERKSAEMALRTKEESYRLLFEGSRDALMTLAPPSWRFASANHATLDLFGATSVAAFTSLGPWEVSPQRQPDGRPSDEKAREEIATAMREGRRFFEWEHQRLDGTRFLADVLMTRIDLAGATFLQATVRDITQRKRAEATLHRYNRALRTFSAGNEILVHAQDEQRLLQDMCGMMTDTGGFPIAWIAYAEHGTTPGLRLAAHSGFPEHEIEAVAAAWAASDFRPTGEAIRTGEPQVVQDLLADPRLSRWHEYARSRGCAALMALPLRYGTVTFGAFAMCAGDQDAFDADMIHQLSELADALAFGINTLRARVVHALDAERLLKSMEGTIQAMAATLEMRDAYTAGHQRRVADLAVAIARELHMPDEQIRGLHLAGIVHDLGKIQIPAEILSKPTKLSKVEYDLIKSHPRTGYDILKAVDFRWPIAEVVFQHHERLDGSGYPRGLKDAGILPEAKILAIADTVEAMYSHRPYRAGLGIDPALAEIIKGRGTIYDAAAVDACVKLFREQRFAFSI